MNSFVTLNTLKDQVQVMGTELISFRTVSTCWPFRSVTVGLPRELFTIKTLYAVWNVRAIQFNLQLHAACLRTNLNHY